MRRLNGSQRKNYFDHKNDNDSIYLCVEAFMSKIAALYSKFENLSAMTSSFGGGRKIEFGRSSWVLVDIDVESSHVAL